ncbi:radical SAM/SPASM domain-containing protein [Clostridium sporogenes]|nr:radical SAM protein [Clostridium sporogenes]
MVNDIFIFDIELKNRMANVRNNFNTSTMDKIFLDITNKCNVNCAHCFTNSKSNSTIQEMTTDEIIVLIDELAKMNVKRLALGGGEPLVRADIYKIIEYATNKGIRVHISSNGLLLNDQNVARLKSIGLDSIQISIDSSISDKHDEFRGYPGLFDKCMEAIKTVQKYQIPLIIATTINKKNIDDIPNIINMVKNLGIKIHRLIRFVPVGRGEEYKDDLYVEANEFIPLILNIRKQFSEYYFGNKDLLYGMPINGSRLSQLDEFTNPNGCEACKLCVDILPNGNVVPCNYLGWDQQWVAGNVKNKPLQEIIENSTLIKSFKLKDGKIIEECRECNYEKYCGKGCRAVALKYYDNLNYMDPYCPIKWGRISNEDSSK